jgi:hypothetical protein
MNNQNETNSVQDECRIKYFRILDSLFSNSVKKRSFGTLCTLLRVRGIESYYNAFEESKIAFDDFNWMLSKAKSDRNLNCFRRIGLLIYCQAVEMTEPHIILANLLGCILNRDYVIDPFIKLYNPKSKKKEFVVKSDSYPPSAKRKFDLIKKLAHEAGQDELEKSIDLFFNEKIRNAFSHSDYVFTDTHFNNLRLEELDKILCECFAFYEAFFASYRNWMMNLGKEHQKCKWPNGEVLELLRTDAEGLFGFHLHFPKGHTSTYRRSQNGVDAINFTFDKDGRIEFI